MEGESSGVQQAQDQVGQGEDQQQGGQRQDVGTQQKQGQQAPQKDQVSGDDGTDYVAQLKAKDAETEALGKEIADLKAHLADERADFALRSAGARSVTAAKALLAEHDGDVVAVEIFLEAEEHLDGQTQPVLIEVSHLVEVLRVERDMHDGGE